MPIGSTELDYFQLFVEDDFFEKIAAQTNLYAKQSQEKSGKVDKKWYETTAREMKAFIGIQI